MTISFHFRPGDPTMGGTGEVVNRDASFFWFPKIKQSCAQ